MKLFFIKKSGLPNHITSLTLLRKHFVRQGVHIYFGHSCPHTASLHWDMPLSSRNYSPVVHCMCGRGSSLFSTFCHAWVQGADAYQWYRTWAPCLQHHQLVKGFTRASGWGIWRHHHASAGKGRDPRCVCAPRSVA